VDVIPLMIFVCLVLVTLAIGLFAFSVKEHTFEHSERLELLPLLDDDPKPLSETRLGCDDNIKATSADHGGSGSKVKHT